jgi:mono/diheme cytochrome c family protein
MRRILAGLVGLGILGLGVFWVVTMPRTRDMAAFAGLTADRANGERVFWATGCASCHAAEGAKDAARLVLSGGQRFASPFGTFLAPNISPDPVAGIGGWSLEAFVHAVQDGVRPDGSHEFPAMPYDAYAKMAPQDVVDLKAYMDLLPASATPSLPHEVGFPFNIRRSLGGWKVLFTSDDFVIRGELSDEVARGRYIVEAMAHCGECHTPRNMLGGLKRGAWLAGAMTPDGKGKVPNITPGGLDWSRDDVFAYLTTGFTPDFDVVGGHMAHVVDNMGHLPEADVWSIVAYLQSVPAVE